MVETLVNYREIEVDARGVQSGEVGFDGDDVVLGEVVGERDARARD